MEWTVKSATQNIFIVKFNNEINNRRRGNFIVETGIANIGVVDKRYNDDAFQNRFIIQQYFNGLGSPDPALLR